jgi:hypothetical protein
MWGYHKFINFVKRVSIVLIFLLFISFIALTYSVRHVVPDQVAFADFGKSAQGLYLTKTNVYYKNKAVLARYFAINLEKQLIRLSKVEVKALDIVHNFHFAYESDKGRDIFVDELGRVCIPVSPNEIRNQSQKGWLWWKLDSGRTSQIYYRTKPDPEMVKLVADIRAETGDKIQ